MNHVYQQTRIIIRHGSPVPWQTFPGNIVIVGNRPRTALYRATNEFRPPLKGEYFLSGAYIAAYRAPNDFTTSYRIAVPTGEYL